MKRLGLLFLIGYSVSAGVAHAATYYASTSGSTSNTCVQAQSTSTPMRTIAAGLGCLVAGDTLLVRGGTYNEGINNNVRSGTSWSNKVRIAAYPGETVWLKPLSGSWVVYFGNDVGQTVVSPQFIELDGINIDGTLIGDASVLLDVRGGGSPNHIRIQNAEVHHREGAGNTNAAVTIQGDDNEFINLKVHGTGGPYGFYPSGNRNLIDGCDIFGTSTAGVHIYKSGGNPTGNIVRNSRIHDITASYFFGAPDYRLWGILVSGTNSQVYNNIIYNLNFAYTNGNAGVMVYAGSGHQIYNNTITKNTTDGIYIGSDASNTRVQGNIAYGNTGSNLFNGGIGITQSNNLFGVDPLFVDPSSNNFQLQAASRAVDAAVVLSAVTTDIAGVPRPQGSAPDIGAYEYRAQQQNSPPAPPTGVRIVSN